MKSLPSCRGPADASLRPSLSICLIISIGAEHSVARAVTVAAYWRFFANSRRVNSSSSPCFCARSTSACAATKSTSTSTSVRSMTSFEIVASRSLTSGRRSETSATSRVRTASLTRSSRRRKMPNGISRRRPSFLQKRFTRPGPLDDAGIGAFGKSRARILDQLADDVFISARDQDVGQRLAEAVSF